MISFASRLNNGLSALYIQKDKVIILAAAATLVYYSLAAFRELIVLADNLQGKYHESCDNAQYIADRLQGIKRCQRCNMGYKNKRSYVRHLQKHADIDELNRILGYQS